MIQSNRLETCYIKGSRDLNEDAIIVNTQDQIFGVIDGATSVTSYKNVKGETGAFIAAQHLASYFEQVSASKTLKEVVIEANRELRKMMLDSGVDVSKKTDLWSAVFAIVRVNSANIEFIQTGDCMMFATYKDGTIRTLSHDQVTHLDKLTMKKSLKGKKLGYSGEELFQFLLPTIRENRNKSNTLEGYSVLNGEEEFENFLEFGTISRANIEKLFLFTDGLGYPVIDIESQPDWHKMIKIIDQDGLVPYTNYLLDLEESDPLCDVYPRLKKSDDKTGIVINLRKE